VIGVNVLMAIGTMLVHVTNVMCLATVVLPQVIQIVINVMKKMDTFSMKHLGYV